MSAEPGKKLLMEGSEDAGVTFKPFAGMQTRTFTRTNITTETTSQTHFQDCVTHNEYAGRSGLELSGDGIADDTTDASLTLFKRFVEVANSATPEFLIRFTNAKVGTWIGTFIISTFETGGTEVENITFSASFLNKDDVVFTPAA